MLNLPVLSGVEWDSVSASEAGTLTDLADTGLARDASRMRSNEVLNQVQHNDSAIALSGRIHNDADCALKQRDPPEWWVSLNEPVEPLGV